MNVSYYRQHSRTYFERTVTADAAAILQPLVDLVPPPARVLDLGCGSGRDLAWLKAKGYTGMGIDTAPELTRHAREHSGCPILVADFTTYPLAKFNADLIIAVGSLVHIPHEQLPDCIAHLLSGLRMDQTGTRRIGHIYLSLKTGCSTMRSSDGRVFYLWQDDELRAVFERVGLRIIRTIAQPSVLAGDGETSWLGYLLGADAADG